MKTLFKHRAHSGGASFLASLLLVSGSAQAAIQIDQQPLLVAKPVPGNMAIVGSLEFPTMVSKANNTCASRCGSDSGYNPSSTSYIGYFDSNKCYDYVWSANEPERHFSPSGAANNGVCAGQLWSGKFLNWATTQAIDNFRSVLTGGYRVKDVVGETWLEKAWQDGQGSDNNFPIGVLNGSVRVAGATPFTNWDGFRTDVIGRGNKLIFRRQNANPSSTVTAYNPADHSSVNVSGNSSTYEVSVRVKVCVTGMLESNCVAYGANNHKPEGLIQANSENMRYAGFGYLGDGSSSNKDSDINRNLDGGVMRARMKFVGDVAIDPQNGEVSNASHREWDPSTGIIYANPDSDDASATASAYGQTVEYSGVINFINRVGQNFPESKYKRRDNVSELYYAATRYFRGLGNYPAYTDVSGAVAAISGLSSSRRTEKRKQLVDGMPIITNWNDPIQYSCQKNFILGIGDTNTADDGNLPGSPAGRAPTDDSDVDVAELTRDVYSLEGVSQPRGFNGENSTPYMAGLAYHARASDIRDDIDGIQSVSTYWVDIVEFGDLKAKARNQYWLAAKYGGFSVPDGFDIDTYSGGAFPEGWWYTSGDPNLPTGDKRPDNFYTVNNAAEMRDSLTRAFNDIQGEQRGNRSSLALNSTTLEAGSATFQAEYTSGTWNGTLNAYTLDPTTGDLAATPAWDAASQMPAWNARNIKTYSGSAMIAFDPSVMPATLKDELKNASGDNTTNLVNFLRGERANEGAGGYRVRQGILGDIIDSQPVYVGRPNTRLFAGRSFNGASSYASWAASINRYPVVYVGANDGMLHGFNATTGGADSGVETFAYVPKRVIENGMGELALPGYDHRYFVDGELTVADAYDGNNWRTVLVGTLGFGGVEKDRETTANAIFALDVTDPENVAFLWEKSSTDIPALGINQGRPVIAQIANGNWSVLLGNGANSADGKAALISVNVFTGTVTTTTLSDDIDNGLSAVRAWDSNGDGITDIAYAGDLQGNLWKVTSLTSEPRVINKLFQATDPSGVPQPITATPLAGRSPYSQNVSLFFGTGRYVNNGDLTDTQVQSWYGYVDDGNGSVSTRADMVEREILLDVAVSAEITARVIEEGAREDLNGKQGWFIDLYQVAADGTKSALGERMITPNQFQGSALIGNTRIPDASDPCALTGRGVIMAIDPFTGARLADTYFDLDGDGAFDIGDKVEIDGVSTVVSGIGLNTGFSNPSFLDSKMYIPTDDGVVRDLDTNPFTTGAGRTSWRELINKGN